MNADILGMWLADIFLPIALALAGVIFSIGFSLVLIQSSTLFTLFRKDAP
jgi:hypothetical protein